MSTLHHLKLYDLVLKPVVTEKSTALFEKHGQYVFFVRKDATKPALKKAFEHLFDVKVKKINTIVRKGKNRVFRGRKSRLTDTKRAIVTLMEGYKIEFVEGSI